MISISPIARWLLPAGVCLAALCAVAWWLRTPALSLAPRLPGADRPTGLAVVTTVDLHGVYTAGPGMPGTAIGEWASFRGPGRSNVIVDIQALNTGFSESGPPVLWSVALGYGYAAPAVRSGRVYLLDYDSAKQADALRCLSLDDGAEIWRRSYSAKVKFNHGMSRTVPAVSERYVVTIGPKCHVLCVDAESGDFRWGIDLVREFGTKEPPWYAGQCPLLDEDRAILAPAGRDVLLMAIDCATGKPVWTTPNSMGWTMTHSSVLPATLGGRKQYVYAGSGGVAGVDAADGTLLWQTNAWKVNIANVPVPVPCGADRLFLSGGYNAGAAMLTVTEVAGVWMTRIDYRLAAKDFGSDQQTPICHGDALYGVIPDGQLVCLGLDGKRRWASGVVNRYGLGPFLIANDCLWLLNDSGTLTVAKTGGEAFERLAQAKVLSGHDAWGPLALAGTRLLARDLERMVCLDLGAKP
jgi:outer membrane protein assembly factor BamB